MTAAEKAAKAAAEQEQAANSTTEQTAEDAAEQARTAEVKALLKQYKLPRAIVETKSGNVVFDADLIERHLERDAEAYTEITA